jgi:hypothetical protein
MAEGGYEYTTVPEERFEEEDHKSIRSRSSKKIKQFFINPEPEQRHKQVAPTLHTFRGK